MSLHNLTKFNYIVYTINLENVEMEMISFVVLFELWCVLVIKYDRNDLWSHFNLSKAAFQFSVDTISIHVR